jgi:hypothetical protein
MPPGSKFKPFRIPNIKISPSLQDKLRLKSEIKPLTNVKLFRVADFNKQSFDT